MANEIKPTVPLMRKGFPTLTSESPSSLARAILRQSAAGAFSRPPSQVPSGPKML